MQQERDVTARDLATLIVERHVMRRWVHPGIVVLGAWLIGGPATMGVRGHIVLWSDVVAGALLVWFGFMFAPRNAWVPWTTALVGVWLLFAPVVLWASSPTTYVNDTIIGAFVIVLAIVIPQSMPMPGPEIPAGWSYNPSAWEQRLPVIALALIAFVSAAYMATYQLGYIRTVWDPFFEDGTRRTLDSPVSRAWPISVAGIGAAAYVLEALMGAIGGSHRWRTMPWLVALFGIAVVPLGMTSIILIIVQAIAVGSWCTPCLLASLAMLAMMALTLDEVVAMVQYLVSCRAGTPLSRTFWRGGGALRYRDASIIASVPRGRWHAATRGLGMPRTLLFSAAVGVWLMFSPAVFSATGTADDSDRLVGALVVMYSIIALAEVGRSLRFTNVILGLWLMFAPWMLTGSTRQGALNDRAAGLVLVVLAVPRGTMRERCGRDACIA